ncbi:MAG TPA: NAD-dependent epimerase/dehydratase family protein [Myxococcaceae bacterium]|nr:NAD-dependent epimerase/dehydratase family protein [Myxococcaceae bacterium]
MAITRRDLLKGTGGLALGATLARADQGPNKPLKLLILGGTGFIGPHEVEYALTRGHQITLFNRGKTNPGLFPNVEKLHGDRAKGDYAALKGRDWDAVIDNPTSIPRWVRQASEALKGHAHHYTFISTISVYASNDVRNADETAAVLPPPADPNTEDIPKFYGALKAMSERETQKAWGAHSTVIRPGLIVGPGDLSDRFTYWPARMQRGGEVLAPGDPTDPVQFVDARDLAEFTVRCAENGASGTFNVTGPQSRLTVAEMLGAVRAAVSTDVSLTWVAADFLASQKVEEWTDLPVWVPPAGESAGFHFRDIRRALAKGLTFRPLAQTVADTLAFYNGEPEERKAKLRAGLTADREKTVLAAWHALKKT